MYRYNPQPITTKIMPQATHLHTTHLHTTHLDFEGVEHVVDLAVVGCQLLPLLQGGVASVRHRQRSRAKAERGRVGIDSAGELCLCFELQGQRLFPPKTCENPQVRELFSDQNDGQFVERYRSAEFTSATALNSRKKRHMASSRNSRVG